jgi:hypothetical protein
MNDLLRKFTGTERLSIRGGNRGAKKREFCSWKEKKEKKKKENLQTA